MNRINFEVGLLLSILLGSFTVAESGTAPFRGNVGPAISEAESVPEILTKDHEPSSESLESLSRTKDQEPQESSSESSEYAAAVSSAISQSRENAPVTLTDEMYHNLIHLKASGGDPYFLQPKARLTIDKLKRKGYTVENWDKETGIITLRARNNITLNHTKPSPIHQKSPETETPTSETTHPIVLIKIINATTTTAQPSTVSISTSSATSSTIHPTLLASKATTPVPKAQQKPAPSEKNSVQRCPSFSNFINGSKELWDGLKSASGIIDGFKAFLNATLNSVSSVTHCVTQIVSDIGDWAGNIPSEIASTISSLWNSSPDSNTTSLATPPKGETSGDTIAIIPTNENAKPDQLSPEYDISTFPNNDGLTQTINDGNPTKDTPSITHNNSKRDVEVKGIAAGSKVDHKVTADLQKSLLDKIKAVFNM